MDLAKGEADVIQMADWAVQAGKDQGQRDPVDVAREEFATGTPLIAD